MQYLKGHQGSLLQALLRPEIDECCTVRLSPSCSIRLYSTLNLGVWRTLTVKTKTSLLCLIFFVFFCLFSSFIWGFCPLDFVLL